jgi:magnesium transporter
MEHTLKPWQQLAQLISEQRHQQLEDYLDELSHQDLVHALFRLAPGQQQAMLSALTPESAAEVLEEVPDVHAAALLEELPAEKAAAIVAELPSDDVADVLSELDDDDVEQILERMTAEDAAEARELIGYDEDTAGGLMMTEFLRYTESMQVREVFVDLRSHADEYELYNVQYLYITDEMRRLVGILRARDLVLAQPDQRVGNLMKAAESVTTTTMLEDLVDFFEDHDISAVPVADDVGCLIGVVRRRAVYDTVAEHAEEARLKAQGIIGGEELRSMPAFTRAGRRLSWLSLNIGLNILAASIIALYQDTIAAVIALAVFLPIVSDMSGCSGNQAVGVSLRELTLGIVEPMDVFRVWLQEASIGLLNGIALGTLLGTAAWLWQDNGYLGLVVGGALALNTLVAVSIGGTVPLLLKALKIDPAIAAGPILTTVTDMCGFFFVLSFATMMLPLIQQ